MRTKPRLGSAGVPKLVGDPARSKKLSSEFQLLALDDRVRERKRRVAKIETAAWLGAISRQDWLPAGGIDPRHILIISGGASVLTTRERAEMPRCLLLQVPVGDGPFAPNSDECKLY